MVLGPSRTSASWIACGVRRATREPDAKPPVLPAKKMTIGSEGNYEHDHYQVEEPPDDEADHLASAQLRSALAGVESVAKPVAEKVESECRKEQRDAREHEEPPRDRVEVAGLRLGDHVPPRRVGGWIPSPRYDRVASKTMFTGISSVA